MPLKTWADYERLEAPDLNAAFAWSQEMTLPGAWTNTTGADTASISGGAYGEVKHGATTGPTDPLGIFRASDGRLVIPAGYGGLWQYQSATNGWNAVSEPASMQTWLNVDGVRAVNLASCTRATGVSLNVAAGTHVLALNAGQVLFLEARMLNGAGNAAIRRWSLIRLGRGVGTMGATALAAGLLPAPEPGQPDGELEDGA